MPSLSIRKDPYLIMCNMFHYQTFTNAQWVLLLWLMSFLTRCWIFPNPCILWKRLPYLKVIVEPFHEGCLEERVFNAKGIVTEHIVQNFAATLNDSYLPLGKILRSQGLKFNY